MLFLLCKRLQALATYGLPNSPTLRIGALLCCKLPLTMLDAARGGAPQIGALFFRAKFFALVLDLRRSFIIFGSAKLLAIFATSFANNSIRGLDMHKKLHIIRSPLTAHRSLKR